MPTRLPPLEEVQLFVTPKGPDAWSMAVGVGPLYQKCQDFRVVYLPGGRNKAYEAVASLLARKAARAVVDAVSPSETPGNVFALSERYRAELKSVPVWDDAVKQILDICSVRTVMER